ncbi:Transcriptional regulatory protein CseB [Dermatophilus congolensis]|uniref:Transcriptional regulatory protein CseB n=2 Tax=Dermatophilus congolensis TaxID=1863 RepID=A0AA46BP23_9MICO|nr:Transcriptional regulatory protein CseB [Dermatophilus congolensis]
MRWAAWVSTLVCMDADVKSGDEGGLRVLVVEDDDDLRMTTSLVLRKQGFVVETAADGVDALELLARLDREGLSPQVAVVDIAMPRMDGITLTRRLRERAAPLGVIMLTARELPYDQLAGFEAGADDYVIKPFDGAILAARIVAVSRRSMAAGVQAGAGARSRLSAPHVQAVGDLRVDRDGMTVFRHSDGVEITLSGTEFRLLATFLDRPGRVLTKSQLLDLVWDIGDWGDDHVVEVSIGRLRSKIGPGIIHTVRGLGYKLVVE